MSLFDVRFWLYRGANPDQDPSTWGLEEDVSSKIRYPGNDGGAAIGYSGGKGDEAPGIDSGQMTLTVDNRDATFSSLALNTPARMGTVSFADEFARADTTTNGWGTVDSPRGWSWAQTGGLTSWPRVSGTGQVVISAANTAISSRAVGAKSTDVDVTFTVTPLVTATGARYTCGIQARFFDTSNYILGQLSFNPDGSTWIDITRVSAGVATQIGATANPTPGLTYTAGAPMKFRMQLDGSQVRVKAWRVSDPEPAWMATGSDTLVTGTEVRIYCARFASNTNTTNLMAFDSFTAIGLEFCGSLVSVPLRWDKRGNNSWAPLTFAGIIRRMTQGTYPVDSPLRGLLSARSDKTGYWTLEGGLASQTFISDIPGQYAATFSQVTPAGNTDLLGGGPAPVLTADTGQIVAATTKNNGGTGFSCMFFMKLPSGLPSTKTRIARIRSSRGPVSIWDIYVDTAGYYTEGKSSDGTILTSHSATPVPQFDYSQWIAWQLETDNSVGGGNTAWTMLHWQVGNGIVFYYLNGTVSGTALSVVKSAQLTGPSGSAFAHLWMGQNTLPFVDYSFINGATGFNGEKLTDRWTRVCTQNNIPNSIRGTSDDTMGPQRESDILSIFKTIVETNFGAVAERGSGLELVLREARFNLTERFTLDVASGHLDDPPEPIRDDLKYRNRYTVSRSLGGQATYTDPDAEAGLIPVVEGSAQINSETDSVLINQAAWRTYIAMNTNYRWPGVTMNFGRNYTLTQSWRSRGGYGNRIKVTTGLSQVDKEPDLVFEGFSATLWPDGWTVAINASPYEVWRAGVADDTTGLGRADSEGCYAVDLASSTALSIPIVNIDDKPWDTAAIAAAQPIGFRLVGDEMDEQVTVTAIASQVADAFGRTSASSFGSADTGGAYSTSGGSAGNYNVSSGLGRITSASTNVQRIAFLAGQTIKEVDAYWTTAVSAVATGASLSNYLVARYVDASNHYRFEAQFTTAGTVTLIARSVVGGTATALATVTGALPAYSAGTLVRCRAQVFGSMLRFKAWLATDQEPLGWFITVTDTALAAAGYVGVGASALTGNTNVSPEHRFDDLAVNQVLTLSARGAGGTDAVEHAAHTQVRLWDSSIAAL